MLQSNLKALIGKQVKAIGSCGIGKGVEICGTLQLDSDSFNTYTVYVKQKSDFEMPYSVYTQTIEEITQ